MRSPDQRCDHYTRIPAPNPLVLARAAAAPTRLSSDMPKESWVCAVRVKIAVSRAQRRRMHCGGCTRTSSRRMSGRVIGPRHLYMHPGCWLHAPGRLSAERTLNSVIEISLR